MKKSIYTILILVIMAVFLAGCSSTSSNMKKETETETEPVTETEAVNWVEEYKKQYDTDTCFADPIYPRYIVITDDSIYVITNLVAENVIRLKFETIASYEYNDYVKTVRVTDISGRSESFYLKDADFISFKSIVK